MGSLADFFPEGMKQDIANFNLEVGNVIKCFTSHTNPPKEKRFVILGVNENGDYVGSVFINTNVNFNIINSQELLDLQYPVKNQPNDYLDHDSFIDCSELFEFDRQTLYELLIKEPERALGKVSSEDLEILFGLVKSSPIIEPKILKKYKLN